MNEVAVMVRRSVVLFLMLGALGIFSACSEADSVTGADTDLSAELAEVALESDRITEEIVIAELNGMGPVTRTASAGSGFVTEERSFSRTRSCPAGGELTVEGSIVRTADFGTGVMEAEISGSRTRTDCAFTPGDKTITVNGGSMWERFRRRVNGMPDGLQTSSYSGSWVAVSSTGEERSCSFDYTVVRDPDVVTSWMEPSTDSVVHSQ